MEYINISKDNIVSEHLCCAIADKKHQQGVESKKAWLQDRIEEGHVFRKLNTNGKIFIEYAPIEKAWVPVVGENYIYIYCLWVAGSYKGHGYAKDLLEYAINDAKKLGKAGLCTISSKKKKPFVSEKGFFEKFGFHVVDTIEDFELLALDFNSIQPSFTNSAKKMRIDSKDLTIYYSNQCPYTSNSIDEIREYTKENGIKANLIKVDTLEKARNMPCVFNNWATFLHGQFVSNTLLNKNSLEKLLNQK